jgi:uncharacterized protein DUF5658
VPLLPFAAATAALAQVLDLGTFVAMVQRHGLGAEANPIVAGLVGDYGLPMAAIVKVALLAFVIALAVVLERRGRRFEGILAIIVIGATIAAGLLGGATNVATMGMRAV